MKKQLLLDQVRIEIRRRNYSYRTEKSYCRWIKQFVRYHNLTHPSELKANDVVSFLNHLAIKRNVAASTQNQALCALVFLYEQVLKMKIDELHDLKRAKKPKRMPVVLSSNEVKKLFRHINGVEKLVCQLMYGSGLRHSEALGLRILDLDFSYRQIIVRNGKGLQDRITIMPDSIIGKLKDQVRKVRILHLSDLKKGWGRTILPKALNRKYPGVDTELKWQYVFPSKLRRKDPRSGIIHRYHISERKIQRSVKWAVRKSGIEKKILHTLSAIASQLTCFKTATTSEPSRNYWAIKA